MIGILGAGAFGSALAIALGRAGRAVTLWGRDLDMTRRETARLPGNPLPETVVLTANLAELASATAVLLALPMQALRSFLADHGGPLNGGVLVACCKGVDLNTLSGPTALIAAACPRAQPAVLTGPSFAADIARGLPTALTLACAATGPATEVQRLLTTPHLRIYRNTDVAGAELGGALKNVIAIACGAAMGAGYGESARAALLTRGFAEMQRLALALGARAETLAGLSGLGDLVLTATSSQSRNYARGLTIGAGLPPDPRQTVEGVATALAAVELARRKGLDLPVMAAVAALVQGQIAAAEALTQLLNRPLKEE